MASYERLSDLQEHFGIEYSQLSRICTATINTTVEKNFRLVFRNLDFFQPRFAMYNAAIRNRIGEDLPGAALDTALFTDGKSPQVSRPGGPDINQARVYNGHHRVHCLQFQGTSAPDGMIVDFFGPLPGARHDQHMHDASQINEMMAAAQIGNDLSTA